MIPDVVTMQSNPQPDVSAIARRQAVFAFVGVLVFVLLFGAGQVAVAHDKLLAVNRMQQWMQQPNGMYIDRRFFANEADQLLFGDLPKADYSRGGVYFTGASVTRRYLTIWNWPEQDQKWVHNYCVCSAHSRQQEWFTRYLIEQEGLLRAGPGKTALFIELSPFNFRDSHTPGDKILDQVWIQWFQRPGLYRLDGSGIHIEAAHTLRRSFRAAEIRTSSFYNWLFNFTRLGQTGEIIEPAVAVYGDAAIDDWKVRLGPGWQSTMDEQLQQFSRFLDYLRDKKVIVAAIYQPEPSWLLSFEPCAYFREKALALMQAKSIDVVDLRRVLDDSMFCDAHHLNYSGAVKIQPYLKALAEKYMVRVHSG